LGWYGLVWRLYTFCGMIHYYILHLLPLMIVLMWCVYWYHYCVISILDDIVIPGGNCMFLKWLLLLPVLPIIHIIIRDLNIVFVIVLLVFVQWYLGIQLIQWWCIAFVDGDPTQ
jgi:hypothetical protein